MGELIAVDLTDGETHPMFGLRIGVIGVRDFGEAHSEELGPTESENFAEGDVRLTNPSSAVQQRHTIGRVLECLSEGPLG